MNAIQGKGHFGSALRISNFKNCNKIFLQSCFGVGHGIQLGGKEWEYNYMVIYCN